MNSTLMTLIERIDAEIILKNVGLLALVFWADPMKAYRAYTEV